MGRRKKDNPLDYINLPRVDMHPDIKKTVWALFILTIAIVSFLGLISQGGLLGAYLKQSLTWLLGWGRWLMPITFLTWSLFIFFREKLEITFLHYLGLFILFFSILSLMQLSLPQLEWSTALQLGEGGGYLGYWLTSLEVSIIGLIASFVISFFLGLIGLMFVFNSGLAIILEKSFSPLKFLIQPFISVYNFIFNRSVAEAEQESDEAEVEDEEAEEIELEESDEDSSTSSRHGDEEDDNDESDNPSFEQKALPIVRIKADEAVNIWKPTGVHLNLSMDLLDHRTSKPKSGDIKECGQIIQNTLSNFGIEVEMGEVCVGPTVTQYTLRPADGVKLSKIIGLQTNLAMALAAQQLRIEAPIPGQALVGIEVPNRVIATIGLREILESEQFKSKGSKLTFALGKDVTGKPWATTINSMPHLLVAGQTGSGKSVMINSIIISLLYHNDPDDLRFIMIDPKRVELTPYNGIPHLLIPVITDASKTVNALKWTINEMDRRLKLLEKYKKKDIVSFNQTAKVRLPYIVFIIDELADLMMLAGKEAEPGIVRIAQMARAVGIHLILATQRPSVNVITGLIKANMPARIAFAVASGIDSKTILDGSGAEKLLGRGDMLFTNASMSKPKRIQGPLVTEKEIKKIVNEIRRQAGEPEYLEGVTDKQRLSDSFAMGMSGGGEDGDEDDKLEEAREVIISTRKASTTMLQRHLGLGYARAAKLMDILEKQGLIGPANGSKPREVLISAEQYAAGMTMVSIPIHNQAESKAPEEYLDEITGDNDPSTSSGQGEDDGDELEDDSSFAEAMEDKEEEDDSNDNEFEDDDPSTHSASSGQASSPRAHSGQAGQDDEEEANDDEDESEDDEESEIEDEVEELEEDIEDPSTGSGQDDEEESSFAEAMEDKDDDDDEVDAKDEQDQSDDPSANFLKQKASSKIQDDDREEEVAKIKVKVVKKSLPTSPDNYDRFFSR